MGTEGLEARLAQEVEGLEDAATEAVSPMQAAKVHVTATRAKRTMERYVNQLKKLIEGLDVRILEAMEAEELPISSKILGAALYTREDLWVSPLDGDHVRLATVLREIGLTEYLPKSVNSQSMSAYVREHYNKETGEFDDDIDPRLLAVLKVSVTPKVVVNG